MITPVVPVELISMFTEEELEGIFCGEAEVDLTILRKATIYESVCPSTTVLQPHTIHPCW